jgi:predicted RNase H-like nuclease (RuvC/YqgF family)
MSEEGRSINDCTNLSGHDASSSTPKEQEAVPEPELVSEPESEILAPLTDGGVGEGLVEAVTAEATGEEGEQIHLTEVEQSQLGPQTQGKPKKQTKSTIMKIQKSLADTSKQIEKQTAQFNKINQNLHTLQKELKSEQKQSEILIQMRSQINQIQRQISQVQEHQKKITIT